MMSSQVVVLATAMAVSGTVILLALRLQKQFLATQFPVHEIPPSSPPILRSCISSEGKKRDKKKKKRVHFAEDVMDSRRDGEEFRKQHSTSQPKVEKNCYTGGTENSGMPANRVALYHGIRRDRVAQRLSYSY